MVPKPDLKIKSNVSHKDIGFKLPEEDKLDSTDIKVNQQKTTLSHGARIKENVQEEEEKSYIQQFESFDDSKLISGSNKKESDDIIS